MAFRPSPAFWPRLAAGLVACALLSAAALWLATPDPLPSLLARPASPALLDDRGRLINARLSTAEEWRLPIPLGQMGQWLPKVLIAVEDKRFYSHPGIDVLALGRALRQNLRAGRVVSGASTLSSQLVRLATPRPRTLTAKLWEFIGALKLESALSKEEILEQYLNNAPFGGPIRGVEAAALLYFDKRAQDLSLGEAALLIGMLKGPTAYRPDKHPQAALQRRQRIIRQVADNTGFPPGLTALALEESLPAYSPKMPDKARHFADLAFAFLPPGGGVFASSLNMDMQTGLERSLRKALMRAGPDVTAAGLVVDNRNGAIVAYVGNALFDPIRGRHWVDCAAAPRSPGSTLKPFVYALAMEQGKIIPATLLADTPLRLDGEAPRNFDRRYRGPVPAATALADSLNAPAVRVLRLAGLDNVLARLRSLGFAHMNRPDEEYGDSLVLGAGEVTLLELARAYSALARLGEDRALLISLPADCPDKAKAGNPAGISGHGGHGAPSGYGGHAASANHDACGGHDAHGKYGALARYGSYGAAALSPWRSPPSGLASGPEQAAGKSAVSGNVCSKAAAWLVNDILRDTGRMPFFYRMTKAREQPAPAFKTGTSFGLRDAWTVAYSPAHTVAVWFGREDGGADPHLVGLSLAAPAAIGLLRDIEPEPRWPGPPPDCAPVRVCALSGAAPSPACPMQITAWHIPSVWPTRPCSLHVMRNGKSLLEWPPELEDFARQRFARDDLSRDVLIISPIPEARYLITPGVKLMPLALKAEGVAYPVHWYADGRYLGIQEREEAPLYWLPSGGEHRISLLDAKQKTASSLVKVSALSAETEETPPLGEEPRPPR